MPGFCQPASKKISSAGDQKLQSSFGRDVEREEPKKSTETGYPGSCYSTQPLSLVNDSLSLKISGLKSQVFGVPIGCLMHWRLDLYKPMLFCSLKKILVSALCDVMSMR